jgi:hypothetical protein
MMPVETSSMMVKVGTNLAHERLQVAVNFPKKFKNSFHMRLHSGWLRYATDQVLR